MSKNRSPCAFEIDEDELPGFVSIIGPLSIDDEPLGSWADFSLDVASQASAEEVTGSCKDIMRTGTCPCLDRFIHVLDVSSCPSSVARQIS